MMPQIKAQKNLDEIYILTPSDFRDAKAARAGDVALGIPVLEQGDMMRRLSETSKEHYNYLKKNFLEVRKNPGLLEDFGGVAGAALIEIAGKDGQKPMYAGLIVLPDKPHNWARFAPQGISGASREDLETQSKRDSDDYKRFIQLPHEIGHILTSAEEGVPQMTTKSPMKEQIASRKTIDKRITREGEIASDNYAEHIFSVAAQKGLTGNPNVPNIFRHMRTMDAVDAVVAKPGSVSSHGTSPFMTGSMLHDSSRETFDTALEQISRNVAVSTDRLMSEHARMENDGSRPSRVSIWDRKIQSCFSGAADRSYLNWKGEQIDQAKETREAGKKPAPIQPQLQFSEAFRACMVGRFQDRYKLLQEQFQSHSPGSPEANILLMYSQSAEAVLNERDRADPAAETIGFRPAPAVAVKP